MRAKTRLISSVAEWKFLAVAGILPSSGLGLYRVVSKFDLVRRAIELLQALLEPRISYILLSPIESVTKAGGLC